MGISTGAVEGLLFDWNEDNLLDEYGPLSKNICPMPWKNEILYPVWVWPQCCL